MKMRIYQIFAFNEETGDQNGVFYGMGKDEAEAVKDARENCGMTGEWEENDVFEIHLTKKEARDLWCAVRNTNYEKENVL